MVNALAIFKKFIAFIRGNKAISILSTVALWLMPAFFYLEAESFNDTPVYAFMFMQRRPGVALFGVILFYALFAAMLFAFKKAWAAVGVFGGIVTAAGISNYMKFALTGEHFYPHDIVMAGNVGEIAGFANVPLRWWGIVFIVLYILAVIAFAALNKNAPLKYYIRLPIAAVLCAAVFIFFGNARVSEKALNKFGMYFEAASVQWSNYKENGFTGAFALNVAAYGIPKPEGYSAAALNETLARYDDIPAGDGFLYPDIIVVLSESFWDPRLLPGSAFSENPLANFDRAAEGNANVNGISAVSGRMMVPTFGGGTIRTEFEALTGLTCDALPDGVVPYNVIKGDVDSYVRRYKELGYDAVAVHTYQERFYNRDVTLPKLGFDHFYGMEAIAGFPDVPHVLKGPELSDYTFELYLEHFLKRDGDTPLFLFGISMESHQPYKNRFPEHDISAENPSLNQDDINRFQNYTQGMKDADAALGSLINYIDNAGRPTVLAYFGDHLPSICVNYSSYVDSGFIGDTSTQEAREKICATPYLIYANFPLKPGKGGESPAPEKIASYDFLNILADAIDAPKSRYMGYLAGVREVVPYYNSRLLITLTDEMREALKIQRFATYKAVAK